VLQIRRQNRPAKAGWQAWSTKTRSLGHELSLPWYVPRWGPGEQPGPTVTAQRPSGIELPQTGSRGTTCLREQVVSRRPGQEEGSPKKRTPSPNTLRLPACLRYQDVNVGLVCLRDGRSVDLLAPCQETADLLVGGDPLSFVAL
jgi:hypothetical protein